jgi:hypothetical protein
MIYNNELHPIFVLVFSMFCTLDFSSEILICKLVSMISISLVFID